MLARATLGWRPSCANPSGTSAHFGVGQFRQASHTAKFTTAGDKQLQQLDSTTTHSCPSRCSGEGLQDTRSVSPASSPWLVCVAFREIGIRLEVADCGTTSSRKKRRPPRPTPSPSSVSLISCRELFEIRTSRLTIARLVVQSINRQHGYFS